MTNYYRFYVKIAIRKRFVHYFSSYLHDKYCILPTTYKRTRQQIDAKIQSFHVNDLERIFDGLTDNIIPLVVYDPT